MQRYKKSFLQRFIASFDEILLRQKPCAPIFTDISALSLLVIDKCRQLAAKKIVPVIVVSKSNAKTPSLFAELHN